MVQVHSESRLARLSRLVLVWSGSSTAFLLAVGVVLVWLVSGPFFHFCDTWQLVINTGTTVITFWMVFLIQRAQNNDSRALHLKLDEIIAALKGASNRLLNIEDLSERELTELQKRFHQLRELAEKNGTVLARHSVEEVLRQVGEEAPAVQDQPAVGTRPSHGLGT
jgi:low affinity Fe/Cu permease